MNPYKLYKKYKLDRLTISRRRGICFRMALPVIGFLALIWFMIRVIPKPSRAMYPCQRVAFPLASSFVVWLVGICGAISLLKRAQKHLKNKRAFLGMFCSAGAVLSFFICLGLDRDERLLAEDVVGNQPVGTAQGIYPGRVVWVHDPNATNWNGPGSGDGYLWQPEHTDQRVVDDMMSRAIRNLAGRDNDQSAWDAIFRHFNSKQGRGYSGYVKGEKVTIKVNLTTCNQRLGSVSPLNYDKTSYLDKADTSPQMIVALLRQLVDFAGVEPGDIAVGDTLAYFPNQWWDICHSEFRHVQYFDCQGYLGRTRATPSAVVQHWSKGGDAGPYEADYVPAIYTDAQYLINLAVLKGHGAGVTLCAKNHYGSYIRLPDESGYYDLHNSLAGNVTQPGSYRALVDIMGHPEMGGKTLLYLLDGLYGGYYWQGTPYRFQMPPFNDDWPSSLFMSQDPVAIDSVGTDFLWEEWPHVVRIGGVDDYLHESALADNPPSGVVYDPAGDGEGLASMGVHEHWNNPIDKMYSGNLANSGGIELIYVPCAEKAADVVIGGDFDGNGRIDLADYATLSYAWLSRPGDEKWDIRFDISEPADGIIDLMDLLVFCERWMQGDNTR